MPPLIRANAKFACVTRDRAIAGSDPSFQTVEHLQQTAFDGGGLLPPNAVRAVNMTLPEKPVTTEPEYFSQLGPVQL